MKVVIQRVDSAKVIVEGKEVSAIGKGYFILLGVGEDDGKNEVEKLAQKVFKMRLMPDRHRDINRTVNDVNGEFLVVSQFTLLADTRGGNRPSFLQAADPKKAHECYELFVTELERLGGKVQKGSFGNFMEIKADLSGPVTIIIE